MNIKGFIGRAEWYEARLDFDVYDWKDRLDWCKGQFGPASNATESKFEIFQPRWYQQFETIYFRDEKDYLLYILRWS